MALVTTTAVSHGCKAINGGKRNIQGMWGSDERSRTHSCYLLPGAILCLLLELLFPLREGGGGVWYLHDRAVKPHNVIELLNLEKTSVIVKSNCQPLVPCPLNHAPKYMGNYKITKVGKDL